MGNYQEVLRQMSPLREVDPGQNRVHMFGNPFKLAKDQVINGINSLNKSGKIKGLGKNVLGKVLYNFLCNDITYTNPHQPTHS